MVLLLSTSSSSGCFAVVLDNNGTIIKHLDAIKSELLPFELDNFISKIKKIYLDVGPGSFTGIKAGIAYVLGIVAVLKIPVVQLSSFDIMQFGYIANLFIPPQPPQKTAFIIPFRGDEFYARIVNRSQNTVEDLICTSDYLAGCEIISAPVNAIQISTGLTLNIKQNLCQSELNCLQRLHSSSNNELIVANYLAEPSINRILKS